MKIQMYDDWAIDIWIGQDITIHWYCPRFMAFCRRWSCRQVLP